MISALNAVPPNQSKYATARPNQRLAARRPHDESLQRRSALSDDRKVPSGSLARRRNHGVPRYRMREEPTEVETYPRLPQHLATNFSRSLANRRCRKFVMVSALQTRSGPSRLSHATVSRSASVRAPLDFRFSAAFVARCASNSSPNALDRILEIISLLANSPFPSSNVRHGF
jgi:hypothetical protein